MNQLEVGDEITSNIPELKKEISRALSFKNSYGLIRVIAKYTQKMVEQRRSERVDTCLKLVGRCYSQGDTTVKNAIENVFVFSLDNILFSYNYMERKKVLRSIPTGLYTAYLKQVYASGV